MKNFIVTILFAAGFLSATYAMGQIYNNQAERMTAPLDNAIKSANAMYANVKKAGSDEEQKSQNERYKIMTEPMNAANDNHLANDYFAHP